MIYSKENIYYHPEAHGLVVIDELEHSDGNYCFDTSMLWRHTDGTVYFAESAGCSCPSPFEEYQSVEDLTRVTLANVKQIEEELKNKKYSEASFSERLNFIKNLKQAVKEGDRQ